MRDAKIIVVDDNEAILRSLRTVLSHEFKTIVTVSSPVLLPALFAEWRCGFGFTGYELRHWKARRRGRTFLVGSYLGA